MDKTCTKCKQVLPFTVEFFYRCSASISGLHPNCIACVTETKRRLKERREAGKAWPPYSRWVVYKLL